MKGREILLAMGFEEFDTQRKIFNHVKYGLIMLNTGSLEEVGERLISIGKRLKCEEITKALNLETKSWYSLRD